MEEKETCNLSEDFKLYLTRYFSHRKGTYTFEQTKSYIEFLVKIFIERYLLHGKECFEKHKSLKQFKNYKRRIEALESGYIIDLDIIKKERNSVIKEENVEYLQ